ncbi:MAG: L,D-transpeptidase family protein [Actinomycetota bacterium]
MTEKRDSAGRSAAKRLLSRRLLIVASGIVALVVLGLAGVAWATYDYSERYKGKLLPGTTIGDVDVSGMTSDEATDAVRASIGPDLDREITINFKDKSWTTTPRELGARGNARWVVGRAARASDSVSFIEKARMRLFDDTLGFSREVAIKYPKRRAAAMVDDLAKKLNREPVDASIDYATGWVEITPSEIGLKVDTSKTTKSLRRAMLGGDGSIEVAYAEPKPEVTADSFDQVLLFRNGENKLYFYQDGEITHSWTVAAGQPEYPTPSGLFEVTERRYMPTWINPSPDGWGSNMPVSIPPGPNNPLGLRAINWSAPAIRFHGTEATYSLGYNASHGCVRMSNSDVIELYDMIEVGATIVSVEVAPLKPMYASAPDPTPVAEDSDKPGRARKKADA